MYKNQKITLCLPARNEASGLEKVIATVPGCVDEIIVISNGSTDDTVKVASNLGVKVVEDDRAIDGIGYGFAHMSGIEAATGDIIVGADCDGSYPLEDIPRIIDQIVDENIDFISCKRYPAKPGVRIPRFLQAGVAILSIETRLLYRQPIRDVLSGMWAFKSSIKNMLDLNEGGWNFSPQIKISAMTQPDITFSEFHIAQHPRLGKSHQSYFKTGFSHLRWILSSRLQGPTFDIFMTYGLINSACLIFELALLYGLCTILLTHYLMAASVAFTASLIINYFLCKKWVFTSANLTSGWGFVLFGAVGLIGLGINDGFIWLFTEKLEMYYLIAKLAAAGFVFVASFVARYYLLTKLPLTQMPQEAEE